MSFMQTLFAPKQQANTTNNTGNTGNGNPNGNNGKPQGNTNANNGGQQFNQNSNNNGNNNDGNNNQNGNNNNNSGKQNEPHPLDGFSKMWDNPTTETDVAPSFTLDPKALGDVSGKLDFTQGIDPELMTKAKAGDTNAMFEVFQAMVRGGYSKSLEHGSMLTDKFVGAREAHSGKQLGGKVRSELTQHALSDTPNYQHPVVKKQLTDIARMLQREHPDASPQEIAKQAKTYLNELVSAINPKDDSANKGNNNGQPKETNWDAYWEADEQNQQ